MSLPGDLLHCAHSVDQGAPQEAVEIDGKPFPLTYVPTSGKRISLGDLLKWLETPRNKERLLAEVHDYGSVLLRGFDIQNGHDFAAFVDSLHLEVMQPGENPPASHQTPVVGTRVTASDERGAGGPIAFHHEISNFPHSPMYVLLHCDTPPTDGGETPLVRSDKVYNYFIKSHPEFCAKAEGLGVKFVSILHEEDHPTNNGRGWRSTFNAFTKEEAEERMKQLDIYFEWLPNNDVKTITPAVPAVEHNRESGRKSFSSSVVTAFSGWITSSEDPKKAVRLGDDTPVDQLALDDLVHFMRKECVAFKWKKNDVLIIDNTITMHSRNRYSSPRRVLKALARHPLPPPLKVSQPSQGISPLVTLNNGRKMPLVGFGLWKVPGGNTADLVYEAIRNGYRHFDSAADYGIEQELGEGIHRALKEGLVSREDLWITSKLWNTYHAKEHVREACLKSLRDIGIDYFDAYLIHFPLALRYVPIEERYPPGWFYDPDADHPKVEVTHIPVSETWRGMEQLYFEGLAKTIGVSNFNVQLIRELLSTCDVKPAINQVEIHPYFSQKNLVRYCRGQSIMVTAYSPLGAGSYTSLGMADASESVLEDEKVKTIASKHSKTPAQVTLKWGVQRGTAVIPKSSRTERLIENISLFDFELAEEDMETMESLNKNRRFLDPAIFLEKVFNTFCPLFD